MSIQKEIKNIALTVLLAIGVVAFSIPAQAAMVGTAKIVGGVGGPVADQEIIQQKRNWIQVQLEANGVSPADSVLRVNSLSNKEVIQIHQRVNEMPAGAGAAGAVLAVFIVLIITDMMGATDIFPFIRPVEK
jgi:hypothetical protein